jgi:multidrug efflux system membrane fusion protein
MGRFAMRFSFLSIKLAGLTGVLAGTLALWAATTSVAETSGPAAPPATPVSVAVVERRDVATWAEFSGRLEAVNRVEVRPRVAGAVQAVHFREGALVKAGDPLLTIDPAPYAAEVERAEGQVAAAQASLNLAKTELDRGRPLFDTHAISHQELDTRENAYANAQAALQQASAGLESARLNLGYTEIKAPIAGRVGRIQVTVGNLVAAGPGSAVLTTLVSVDPIYATFDVDERTAMSALDGIDVADDGPRAGLQRIPVELVITAGGNAAVEGHLQLIDNEFDAASGTVRLRAVFDNPHGHLIPGQFARVRVGQAKAEPALLVSDRAIGTDQDKKFVMVVDGGNKAVYREIKLGTSADGLRVVTSGLSPGERVIVNGLQRVRPGGIVAPETVPMTAGLTAETTAAAGANQVAR